MQVYQLNEIQKIIYSYDRLHARTFVARLKSLRARYAHAYKHTRNILRPD